MCLTFCVLEWREVEEYDDDRQTKLEFLRDDTIMQMISTRVEQNHQPKKLERKSIALVLDPGNDVVDYVETVHIDYG